MRSTMSSAKSDLNTGMVLESPVTNGLIPSTIKTRTAGLSVSTCKPGSAAINTDSIGSGTLVPCRSMNAVNARAIRAVDWTRFTGAGLKRFPDSTLHDSPFASYLPFT